MKDRILMICIFVLVSVSPASAQLEGNPENWCRNGAFPADSEEYRIGTIKGTKGQRAYFYNDFDEDCPNNEKCKEKSYVVPGDKVIVSRNYGKFACSWFSPAKGQPTVGWIRSESVTIGPAERTANMSAWLGIWRYFDNTISITRTKRPAGKLKVAGTAFWKGYGDNIHIGELGERVAPVGRVLRIGAADMDKYACKATMRLVGAFLIVADNLNCGGANVSFTGVYKRK